MRRVCWQVRRSKRVLLCSGKWLKLFGNSASVSKLTSERRIFDTGGL